MSVFISCDDQKTQLNNTNKHFIKIEREREREYANVLTICDNRIKIICQNDNVCQ